MPCWEVNLISVEFKGKNVGYLKEAARLLEWSFQQSGNIVNVGSVTIDLQRGTASSFTSQGAINKLKQTYSLAAVQDLAKKKKWAVKVKGANKLELRRY